MVLVQHLFHILFPTQGRCCVALDESGCGKQFSRPNMAATSGQTGGCVASLSSVALLDSVANTGRHPTLYRRIVCSAHLPRPTLQLLHYRVNIHTVAPHSLATLLYIATSVTSIVTFILTVPLQLLFLLFLLFLSSLHPSFDFQYGRSARHRGGRPLPRQCSRGQVVPCEPAGRLGKRGRLR